MGDFNDDFNKVSDRVQQVTDIFESFLLFRNITHNTRMQNCTDNVFSNYSSDGFKYTIFIPNFY